MLKFKTLCAVLAYLSSNLLREVGLSLFRYFEVGLRVCDIVVKKFTFAISSPDEFLFTERLRKYMTARRLVLRMEIVVTRIPYISVMRSAMITDDRVRLVYFDEKRTSISNIIVIFHVFPVISTFSKKVSCKYRNQ